MGSAFLLSASVMVGTPRVVAGSMRYDPLGRSAAGEVRAVRRLANVDRHERRRSILWADHVPVHQVPRTGGLYRWRGGAAHSCPSGEALSRAGRIEKPRTRRRNPTALGPSRH